MINAPHIRRIVSSRPVSRTAVLTASILALGIFALDLKTSAGYGVGALYLIPLLLASVTGPPRIIVINAWIVTMLITAGLLEAPWSDLPGYVFVNRAIAIGAIWIAALIVLRFRETSLRLEERTRDLADMSYALEQSAIVATTDIKGKITFANDRFCQISKYSRDELLGQDHRLVNSGYHPKEFFRDLWRTIAAGQIWRGEIRNRAKDGAIYWVDTTIVPFLDEAGKPYQYMAIRYEITDRKRSDELLREQAALARLGQMAAVVAHEVKNPIAGIRGALQVIASRMSAEQRDRAVIGDIISRLDSLNAIVQDLLVFARPRQLRPERVELESLVGSTAELIRRDPIFSGIDVTVSGGPAVITADAEALKIALQNILINAAQAMSGVGRIDVAITSGDGMARVSIRDSGPGMPAEVREKAFEAFFTTKHRGTGLGLPTARRFVEAHGGDIQIDTPPEGGTTIVLTLPTAPQS